MSHYPKCLEVDINGLTRLIDNKKPTCRCGVVLLGHNINYHKHKDGVRVKGITESQWVGVHCDKCGYNMPLWKISEKLRGDKR